MDRWMMWKERFRWVDAVVLSQRLLLGHVGCCTDPPICLPSHAHTLLEGREQVTIIFPAPESDSQANSMKVCGMKNEQRGTYLGLKHA